MTSYVIGIDIGTTSVRGALVTRTGELQKIATKKINTWNPRPQFYQQSSDEIWSACCTVVKVSKHFLVKIFLANLSKDNKYNIYLHIGTNNWYISG